MAFPPGHQTHVEERGLAMPAETRETRRPRTQIIPKWPQDSDW